MPYSKLPPAEQVEFLHLLLDSTLEGFYSVDTEGVTTMCNSAFLKLLGYDSVDEVVGRKLHGEIHHTHPDGTHYEVTDCPIYNAAKGGTGRFVTNELFFRKDGSSFSVEYRAEPIMKDGKSHGAICTFLDITEKQRQQRMIDELRDKADRAAERISLALDSGAVAGTWVWDIKQDVFTGDERFALTFGLDAKKLERGLKIADIKQSIHSDDIARVENLMAKAMANGGAYRAQYRVLTKNKIWQWIEATGRVELNAAGEAVRFPGVLIDIDARKRTELALAETQSNYESLFNSIDQGFCVIEVLFNARGKGYDYRFLQINPAFEQQTGLKDVIGKTMLEIAPGHEHLWGELYGEVSKTGTPIRREDRAAAVGRWFDIYAFKPANAQPGHVAVLFSDITERKESARAVEESQAHLSLMVESAHEFAIVSIERDGKVISWNNGAERVFGYAPQEVIGKSVSIIFTPEDRAANVAERELEIAAKEGRASDERWHIRKNGERFYASGIMTAMRNESGNITGFIKIARDMTKEQRAQESLIEARNEAEAANIAKTEFLANMSHEIRTPMNAIIGLSNILSMSQPLTPKQKEFVKTLQMSADSLLSLINDLLDISKIEARSVELEHIPFSVTQLIQEVVSMMAVRVKEKGLTFTGDGESVKDRMFMGDPTRLRQIVLNLCSNAIKFTEKGGVHVSITCEAHPSEGKETVCIAVSDTGIGIAPENVEHIFHKFVQADTSINRKYGGTGLGLAITKTLTEIMGGTITVQSAADKGSTFKVCVPLEIASDADIINTDLSLSTIIETLETKIKPRILLVEDYAPNVMVASNYLEQFGYTIDVAENGLEGFEKAIAGQYFAVLMDVQMHGMNGFEATKLIREHEKKNNLPRLLIIGMTAHALSGDRERCISAGMDDYIAKPFNPEDLRSKLYTSIET